MSDEEVISEDEIASVDERLSTDDIYVPTTFDRSFASTKQNTCSQNQTLKMALKAPGWLNINKHGRDYIECEWENTTGYYRFVLFEVDQDDKDHAVFTKDIRNNKFFNSVTKKIKLDNVRLNPNQHYKIEIHSIEEMKCSEATWNVFYSNPVSPHDVKIEYISATSAKFDWSDFNENYCSVNYKMEIYKGNRQINKTIDIFDKFVDVKDLVHDTEYSLIIRSVSKSGVESSNYHRKRFKTLPLPIIQELIIDKDSVQINWNIKMFGLLVNLRSIYSEFGKWCHEASSMKFTHLKPSTKYDIFILSGHNDIILEEFSTLGAVPQNLKLVSVDKEDVNLSWNCEGIYKEFEIVIYEVNTKETEKRRVTSSNNSDYGFNVCLDELEVDTDYTVCVKSVNINGKMSDASNIIEFKTKYGIRPPSLTNIGANCYLNSALQAISSSDFFVDAILNLCNEIGGDVKQLSIFNSLIQIMSGRVKIDNSRRKKRSNHGYYNNRSSIEIEISRDEIFRNWCKTGQQDSFELISHIMNEVYQNINKYLEKTGKIKAYKNSEFLNSQGLPLRIIFKNMVICACNSKVETPYQSALALHVPITNRTGTNQLQDLVDRFFKLDCVEEYECDNDECDGKDAKRIVKLVELLPKTMCIQLQRSYWNGYRMQKIDSNVTFTDSLIMRNGFLLDEDNCTSEDDDEAYCEYKLTAVIVHMGSVDGGHYVCYKRSGFEWYFTNDSWVNVVDSQAVFKVEPYILLYETSEDLDQLKMKRAKIKKELKIIKEEQLKENEKFNKENEQLQTLMETVSKLDESNKVSIENNVDKQSNEMNETHITRTKQSCKNEKPYSDLSDFNSSQPNDCHHDNFNINEKDLLRITNSSECINSKWGIKNADKSKPEGTNGNDLIEAENNNYHENKLEKIEDQISAETVSQTDETDKNNCGEVGINNENEIPTNNIH